jgi:hypothetical protein
MKFGGILQKFIKTKTSFYKILCYFVSFTTEIFYSAWILQIPNEPKLTNRSMILKGAFTLANFVRDFALSLHILLNKNYLFSLLKVQASAKSRQCKRT